MQHSHLIIHIFRGPNSGSARTTTPAITHRTPTTTVPLTPTTGTTTTSNTQSTPSAGLSTPQNTISTTTPNAPTKARTETNNEATPPASTGATTGSSSGGRPIQLSDLQSFLQGITPPGGRSDQSGKILPRVHFFITLND